MRLKRLRVENNVSITMLARETGIARSTIYHWEKSGAGPRSVEVVQCGDYGDGYGNQVLLYHASIGTYSRYAHCSELYADLGDIVTAGTIIAAVGSTGNSTGPHLHLEYIIPDGSGGYEYANPLTLFD